MSADALALSADMADGFLISTSARCACGGFNVNLEYPASILPISRSLCLCNQCRAVSGSCGVSYINLPSSLSSSIDPTSFSLKAYPSTAHQTRYFCTTCGSHVLCRSANTGEYRIATGILSRTEGIVKWTGTKMVGDTKDGGVGIWLQDIVDADGTTRKLGRWTAQDGVPAKEWTRPDILSAKRGDKLKASCHCGGVKFYVTRPNEASKKVSSPFPDLMIPYHEGHTSANPRNLTWWLRGDNTKYLAGTCMCESCRLALGFEIQTWAFIPKYNIFFGDGKSLDFKMGTLSRYESSEGAHREFCSTCGATVFWHCEERPELIDVSVGLFDPEEGARVERWLEWWPERVSFKEMSVSTRLAQSLEEGLREWGEI